MKNGVFEEVRRSWSTPSRVKKSVRYVTTVTVSYRLMKLVVWRTIRIQSSWLNFDGVVNGINISAVLVFIVDEPQIGGFSLAKLIGPVAQLGERCVRIAEVRGSNPLRSTKQEQTNSPKGEFLFCLIWKFGRN